MDISSIGEWFDVGERILSWGVAAGGFALLWRKHVLSIIRSVQFTSDLRHEFGSEAAKEIISRLDIAEATAESTRELEAELGIVNDILCDALQIGIFYCDLEGGFIHANGWLCRSFGLPREKMLGNGWLRAVHKDDQDRVYESWRSKVAQSRPYSESYRVCNLATGKEWEAVARASELMRDGKPVLYVGSVRPKTVKFDSDPARPINGS